MKIKDESAVKIESADKGLLLPRVALDSIISCGLVSDVVVGMKIFNANPAMNMIVKTGASGEAGDQQNNFK